MARNYKKEYKKYHSKPDQRVNRSSRNKARRKMVSAGKIKKSIHSLGYSAVLVAQQLCNLNNWNAVAHKVCRDRVTKNVRGYTL